MCLSVLCACCYYVCLIAPYLFKCLPACNHAELHVHVVLYTAMELEYNNIIITFSRI